MILCISLLPYWIKACAWDFWWNCSHFILKWFQPNCFWQMCFLPWLEKFSRQASAPNLNTVHLLLCTKQTKFTYKFQNFLLTTNNAWQGASQITHFFLLCFLQESYENMEKKKIINFWKCWVYPPFKIREYTLKVNTFTYKYYLSYDTYIKPVWFICMTNSDYLPSWYQKFSH